MGGGVTRTVVVNQSYVGQRVTGQQRYATEIAGRLGPATTFTAKRPAGFWAASKARVWAWVQFVLPVLARGAAVLSMTSRAPLWCRRHVLVVHDLFVISHPEWYSRSYVWTHAPLLRAQIRTAAGVVAVSQPVADELAALGRTGVQVAPNAPSDAFVGGGDEPSTVLVDKGIDRGSYFLAVGSRDPRKNLHRLAEAYGMLDEDTREAHALVLVGGGASIYRDQEITWPSGTVEAGYVDDDELRRLYRDARSVVFVSLAEGFGLPLVEAAAAGAPSLLISDIEVFRWICGDGARYVDPMSSTAIAAGLREELVEQSQADIDLSRFDWDRSAAAVESVCLAVAGGR